MVYARQVVDPPSSAPYPYGLLNAVDWRPNGDPHVFQGIQWNSMCPADANTTVDPCFTGGGVTAKSKQTFQYLRGATPFTVYTEVDCSPPGFWDSADDKIAQAMAMAEGPEVETVLWTGSVAGTGNGQYPHLAANATVTDSSVLAPVTLQTATGTVTGSTILDVVEGLGRLEAALLACAKGTGFIHVTPVVLELMAAWRLVELRGGQLYTMAGNRVVVGAGYTGSAPDGTSAVGSQWMYATGPLFGYRSAVRTFDKATGLDRNVNTLKLIVERTYVVAYDCCIYGVAVSTGGIITGTPNSAT